MIEFNVMPVALTGGVVYLLMALTVWGMLRGTPHAPVVRLWALGSACIGTGLLLSAGRSVLPIVLGFGLAAVLNGLGLLVKVAALRHHLGRATVWPPLLRGLGVGMLLIAAMVLFTQKAWIFVGGCALLASLCATLAWHAHQAARQAGSRNAALLAWTQWLLVAALAARGADVAVHGSGYQYGQEGLTFALLHAAALLAALYGSLGFMGLLLDLTGRDEARAREAQVAEAARRQAAERAADDLRQLLAQRDALADERERMLQLLAHEVRQPLHNASGALRAAAMAAAPATESPLPQVAERLGRAEAVLDEVRSVLDNTLAAAMLLSRRTPLLLQEVDLAFVIDLALGDLGDVQRARLQVSWHTDLRQVEVEPGLLRLALRNLLRNAFEHGPPGVSVQVQVHEQRSPPALLLQVLDDGPGLRQPAGPAPAEARRPGLGLAVARQVASLHGGRLDLLPRQPRGLAACLVLPLPADSPAEAP